MPTIPFTFDAMAGFALGLVFAIVAIRRMDYAVMAFVALGWIPFFQVASLSGREFVTGLMQVEWLATVLILVWLIRRPPGRLFAVTPARFNGPLFLLIPLSVLSLVTGTLGLDTAVDARHVKLAVSFGQILLFAWPIGIYVVVASTLTSTKAIERVVRLITWLALPAVALLVLPATFDRYLGWSVYFAFVASPLCLAASLSAMPPLRRVACLAVAVAPALHGLLDGKALWYAAPVVAAATILTLRARHLLVVFAPVALGAYLLIAVPLTGSLLPGPLEHLVDQERSQQSWGGPAGRVQLARDALSIWIRYPVFGVGPGNNYPYMDHYSVIATPHGQYLNILLEMGVVGLGCYLVFIGTAFAWGLALFRTVRGGPHETVVLGWLGLFAGMAVAGLLGDFSLHSIRNDGLRVFSWYYPQWVVLGLVVAVSRIEAR